MQTGKPETKERQMLFQIHRSFIFGNVISRYGVKPDPWKLNAMTEMPPKNKKEPKAFLGIINY